MKRLAAIVLCLFAWASLEAQNPAELLSEVNPNKAQRLYEYNAVFLQELLYFSKRHRIVKVDTKLLLKGEDFTITPFDDMEPIHIVPEFSQKGEDIVSVIAHVVNTNPNLPPEFADTISFVIALLAYDLNESDEAVISAYNKLAHSPHWEIDEFGIPVLETTSSKGVAGPPPITLEEIEWHKKIKKLKKHQFFSVGTTFQDSKGKHYSLSPLKYSPKYSVIHEYDSDKLYTLGDQSPTGPSPMSEDDKRKHKQFADFVKSLPKEKGKIVRGDSL